MSICRLACVLALFAWLAPLAAAEAFRAADYRTDNTTDNAYAKKRSLGSPLALRPFQSGLSRKPGPGSQDNTEHEELGDGLLLPDLPHTKVRFVDFLPPDKTGMTTGGPGDVTILINRNYPPFVQYSTLVHESVHARDRQLDITPHLTIAQRETRALLVELSPANVLATAALAALTEGPQVQHRVTVFFQDVLAHYKRYSAMVAMQTKRPPGRTDPSPIANPVPFLRTTAQVWPERTPR